MVRRSPRHPRVRAARRGLTFPSRLPCMTTTHPRIVATQPRRDGAFTLPSRLAERRQGVRGMSRLFLRVLLGVAVLALALVAARTFAARTRSHGTSAPRSAAIAPWSVRPAIAIASTALRSERRSTSFQRGCARTAPIFVPSRRRCCAARPDLADDGRQLRRGVRVLRQSVQQVPRARTDEKVRPGLSELRQGLPYHDRLRQEVTPELIAPR